MKFKFLYWILFEFGILIDIGYSIGVSVSCSLESMDLMFTFDDPFYGKIMMKPNQSCTAKGKGHAKLKLTISLDEETRNRCSIVMHGGEYIGAVDIQMHENLRMQEDISYLIRCPTNNPAEIIPAIPTKKTKEPLAKLKIFDKKKNSAIKTAIVGKQYDMHLVVPYQKEIPGNVKVGQCIAFTGEEELKLVQLTDNEGCPMLKEVAHEFRQEYNVVTGELPRNLSYKTSIEMFSLGNASHFFLQCQLQKCDGTCLKANCSNSINSLQNNKKLLDSIDRHSMLTSMRIDVNNKGMPTTTESNELLCKTSTTEKVILSILIALLAILTSASWIFAIYKNRKNFNLKIFKDLKTIYPSSLKEFKQQLCHYRERVTTFLSSSASCRVSRSHSFTSNYSKSYKKTFQSNNNNSAEKRGGDVVLPTKLDISLPIFPPPIPPIRTSLLDFSAENLHERLKKDAPIFDEFLNLEELADLDAFPEPPSISLDEIQELNNAFNNVYSSSENESQKEFNHQNGERNAEFNDASSTLDRPVIKKNAIKRTETLDFDSEKKPSLPANSPPALSDISNPSASSSLDKLKIDPIKLSQSLKLINSQQKSSTLSTSKSTIERPRSRGSPYQLFFVYNKK